VVCAGTDDSGSGEVRRLASLQHQSNQREAREVTQSERSKGAKQGRRCGCKVFTRRVASLILTNRCSSDASCTSPSVTLTGYATVHPGYSSGYGHQPNSTDGCTISTISASREMPAILSSSRVYRRLTKPVLSSLRF
jgi:hypothetical protein